MQVVDEYHSRWQSQDRSRLESRRTREREAVWKGLQQEEARREEIKARKEEAKRDFFNGRESIPSSWTIRMKSSFFHCPFFRV